ncbi:GNAT family N-acetyltransferase [Streptomyces sclerotialus]|uniref:GNAT family N-acetyltransferase n=1 Tax=Streptomyces sclerotialus TaxID=1957 RepID=UPI000689E077
MGQVDVRLAVESDTPAVSRIVAESLRNSYSDLLGKSAVERLVSQQCSLARIRTEIGAPGSGPGWLGWLVATTADGTVIGAAAGGIAEAGSGEVYSLCVTGAHRRHGVGSSLLTAVTDQQLKNEARQQRISLLAAQDPAVPFLSRHGFRPAEESAADRPRYARAV